MAFMAFLLIMAGHVIDAVAKVKEPVVTVVAAFLTPLFQLSSILFPVQTRWATRDTAFSFRMGAGFAGDVNRTHPFSNLPGLMDVTNPVRLYGDPVIGNTAANSYRGVLATDTAVTKIDGVLVRPYPVQQTTGGMSAALGAATPPTSGVIDVLREGFILARCNNFATQQPTKFGAVYIWVTASSGAHVQGGFESINNGANTIAITNARWNGPCDSNGIGEIEVWAA